MRFNRSRHQGVPRYFASILRLLISRFSSSKRALSPNAEEAPLAKKPKDDNDKETAANDLKQPKDAAKRKAKQQQKKKEKGLGKPFKEG